MLNYLKNSKINRFLCGLFVFLVFFSCEKEVNVSFEDSALSITDNASVAINIPMAKGNKSVANAINTTLKNFVVSALNDEADLETTTLKQAAKAFDSAFKKFNTQLPEDLVAALPTWEALIDGEITYKNDNLVCIGMTASINTGAAANRGLFEFFNFDVTTGKHLQTSDIIENQSEFTKLVKKYYDKELKTRFTSTSVANNDTDFKLPKTLGFSDDGVIILFDNFEAASQDILEFTIPFEAAKNYLKYY